uniref:Uncharacterized protein n=1 Tax=Pipistrellus kuhlii TaxID=59472 RepID=A0A7J7Y9K1_PIPKU|nr:hypothetical protein mPipKuh1_010332 [Pipistrellus kuhlii]
MWRVRSGTAGPDPEHSAWSRGGMRKGFVVGRRVCLTSVTCPVLVRYGWMLGLPPLRHLIPSQCCHLCYVHLRLGKMQESLCALSKESGRLLGCMGDSELRSSRYPPEQAGWRMQLRFRGAQVPGARCWH